MALYRSEQQISRVTSKILSHNKGAPRSMVSSGVTDLKDGRKGEFIIIIITVIIIISAQNSVLI